MAKGTGKDLYVTWAGTELDAEFRSFEGDESASQVDITAGDDEAMDYISRLRDGTRTMNILDDGTTALWAAIEPGVNDGSTLEWGPQGTASGNPKYTVTANISNRSESHPYDEVRVFTVDFQFTAKPTQAEY